MRWLLHVVVVLICLTGLGAEESPETSRQAQRPDREDFPNVLEIKHEHPTAHGFPSGVTRLVVSRFGVGLLERHHPKSLLNGWKLLNGVEGDLMIFDTGMGYVSKKAQPGVKPARKRFLTDGHLKFFVPLDAILSVEDVSVLRSRHRRSGDAHTSFLAEVRIDRGSAFFQEHTGLMTESDQDNRLYLAFKDKSDLSHFTARVADPKQYSDGCSIHPPLEARESSLRLRDSKSF